MDDKKQWDSPMTPPELVAAKQKKRIAVQSRSSKRPSPLVKGYKFKDPYEVFRKVFREEFGEDFVPGQRPNTTAALPPKPVSPQKSKPRQPNKLIPKSPAHPVKQTPSKTMANIDDQRALAGRTQTKQILHGNGQVETITTTIITRPNGKEEVVTKSSMEKLSAQQKEKLHNAAPKSISYKGGSGVKVKKSPTPPSPRKVKPQVVS